MKILRIVLICSLGLIFLGGCSSFKSSKETVSDQDLDEGVQTTGFEDDGGFSEYGASSANRLKPAHNQTYYFDLDSYTLKPYDVESIKVQGNYLVKHSKAKVRLEGHTDERGSREYNVALGWKRARAVAAVLRQQGARNSQVAIVSYGREKPVAFGKDEYSHSKNRRVNLVYEVK